MSETVLPMTLATSRELAAALLQQMPLDLPQETAERWIRNKRLLGDALRGVLASMPDRTLDILIKEGRYVKRSPWLSARRAPAYMYAGSGATVEFLDFGVCSTTIAKEWMEERGYRPAEDLETLEYCNKRRQFPGYKPVVVLGSPWRSPAGGSYALMIVRDGDRRAVDLLPGDHDWRAGYLFAAVKLPGTPRDPYGHPSVID